MTSSRSSDPQPEGSAPGGEDEVDGMADAMRQRTRALHVEAERTGIIADLLHGTAGRSAYALLLRNLLPVYSELERGLERHRGTGTLGALARPEVYRAQALRSDLAAFYAPDWETAVPLLASAEAYAAGVRRAADGPGGLLAAHAYVRYLGDLNGGQTLKRSLAKALRIENGMLNFHEFPAIADLRAFRQDYRKALDRAVDGVTPRQDVVEEAAVAFQFNIELSRDLGEF
jgi:heme oxygenase